MAVDFTRKEYEAHAETWALVDKVVNERDLDTLLPELNAHDVSKENRERNKFYRERASWFGASSMTIAGLIGLAYEKAPDIELPAVMEYLRTNCDGEGLDLQQQMQAVTKQVLCKYRCGLFITYPATMSGASLADQQAGKALATIHKIDAERIINWWTVKDGATVKLGGVIFTDTRETVEDYEIKEEPVWRELSLDEGGMIDRTWRKNKDGQFEVIPELDFQPKDGSGKRWQTIPFVFVGANDNTSRIGEPPMKSLAWLNRDHYRNSADHEESVWYAGQAQPFIDPGNGSVTQEDIDTAKDGGFYVGSRQVIMGKFGFAQASPETGARQAMLDKIEQMKALGARFITPGTVAKTATQDAGEQKVQHSILSLVQSNVEDAFNQALNFAALYMRQAEGAAFCAIPRDYMADLTPEMLDRVLGFYDRALIGLDGVLPILKRANLVDDEKDPDEYAEEVGERGGLTDPMDDGNA